MKHHYLLLIVFALCVTSLFAKEVTPAEAELIAKRFSKTLVPATRAQQDEACVLAYTANRLDMQIGESEAPFYVFNYGDAAYVIVSGDDRMEPVLGYSDKCAFRADNIPASVQAWFDTYRKEYEMLQDERVVKRNLIAPFSVWADEDKKSSSEESTSVSPLLGEIAWGQSAPYNNLCPVDGTTNSATGCVATAMAQVMKYFNYPTSGEGGVEYTTDTQKLSVSYDYTSNTFDWDNMLSTYVEGSYNETQAKAVANLMLACGASVSMDYAASESGATDYIVANALINYFSYDANMQNRYRDTYDTSDWIELLEDELNASHPILYSATSFYWGAHMVVIDGYNSDDMFHVNWGWDGDYNGYFKVTALAPGYAVAGSGNKFEIYNYDQMAIVGIQKPNESSVYRHGFKCNAAITLAADTVAKGEEASFTLNKVYNFGTDYPAGGAIGLLYRSISGGNLYGTYAPLSSAIPTGYGWSSATLSFTIPSDLADGYYIVFPAFRNPDNTWSLALCDVGIDAIYIMVASGNNVMFYSYWSTPDAVDATVSAPENLYANGPAVVDVTYTNDDEYGQDYNLVTGLYFYQSSSNYKIVQTDMVYLDAKETGKKVTSVLTLPSTLTAGTYKVYPLYVWNNTWYLLSYNSATVTIGEQATRTNADADITVSSASFDKEEYQVGEDARIVGQIKNNSTDSYYYNLLYWYVFDTTSNYSIGYSGLMPVFIEKGGTYNIDYSFYPNLPAGKYRALLRGASGWLTSVLYFTITDGTGIENVEVEDASLVIYPQPVGETLNLRTAVEAQSVAIYDLSGRQLLQQTLAGGPEYSVAVGQLAAGTYVVNVATADGQTLTAKFVKE